MSNGLVIFKGLIFSDLAIKDAASGKLSLINIFSHLNVVAFPFQSLIFFMTALITNMAGPVEKLSFKVEIIGANGGPKLAEVIGQGSIPAGVSSDDINEIVWPIPPMFIPKAGAYDEIISSGENELERRPLFVRPLSDAQFMKG